MEKQRDFTAIDQMFAQQRDAALPGVSIPVKHPFTPWLAGGRGKLSLIAIVQRADSDAMRAQFRICLIPNTEVHSDGVTLPPQCSNTVNANSVLLKPRNCSSQDLLSTLIQRALISDMRALFANIQ